MQGGVSRAGDAASVAASRAGAKTGQSFKSAFLPAAQATGKLAEKAFLPAVAGLGLLAVGAKKAVDAASDLNEQVNKTSAVFKGSAPAIVKWSETAATSMGMSERQALEATGTFGNMLVPMGIARKEAAGMSQRMVQLASDMSSFNNASPEDTLEAIRAGLAGEAEPLRRFGVFLSAARVQQEALSMGFGKGVEAAKALKAAQKELSAAQKEQAASAKAVATAQSGVTAAQATLSAATRGVTAAQDKLRASNEALSAAEQRQASSTQKVKDAKLALRAAQQSAREAQLALTDARKRATEQLDEMRDAAKNAALGEKRAQLDLARAQERANAVNADATSTQLDREEAALGVEEAQQQLAEAQKNQTQTASDLADAEKKGVEGSKDVVDAKNAIADADSAQEKAARALHDAQQQQVVSVQKVKDALIAVERAQQGIVVAQEKRRGASARVDAAETKLSAAQSRNAKSARDLARAQADVTAAKKETAKFTPEELKGLTAAQKAQAAYRILLHDTHDAQGDFVRTSKGVANTQRILTAQQEDAAARMGKSLLPAYHNLQRTLSRVMGFMAKNPKLVQDLVVAFGALAGTIVAVNLAMKAYRAGVLLVQAVTKTWTAIQWLLNAALDANPIGLLVIAIGALIAAIVIAYTKSDTFRKIIDGLFDAIVDGAKWVLGFLQDHWPEILGILAGPFGLAVVEIVKHWDAIKDAVSGAFDKVVATIKTKASDVVSSAKALGAKIIGGVVSGLSGIGTSAWNVIANVGSVIAQFPKKIAGWGVSVGASIVSGVVSGLAGIGVSAWNVIKNISAVIQQYAATIVSWGTSIATTIKNAVVSGLVGIGTDAWNVISNIASVLTANAKTIAGWGYGVGKAIKEAIVTGIKGLGNAVWKTIRHAFTSLPGKLGGIIGKGLGVVGLSGGGDEKPKPRSRSVAAGPMEVTTGLRATPVAGATEGGGLAGPVPFGSRFAGAIADAIGAPTLAVEAGPLEVRVFIGETELRGIVRTEVRSSNDDVARVLLSSTSGVVT
jgi:hypothetical protein